MASEPEEGGRWGEEGGGGGRLCGGWLPRGRATVSRNPSTIQPSWMDTEARIRADWADLVVIRDVIRPVTLSPAFTLCSLGYVFAFFLRLAPSLRPKCVRTLCIVELSSPPLPATSLSFPPAAPCSTRIGSGVQFIRDATIDRKLLLPRTAIGNVRTLRSLDSRRWFSKGTGSWGWFCGIRILAASFKGNADFRPRDLPVRGGESLTALLRLTTARHSDMVLSTYVRERHVDDRASFAFSPDSPLYLRPETSLPNIGPCIFYGQPPDTPVPWRSKNAGQESFPDKITLLVADSLARFILEDTRFPRP